VVKIQFSDSDQQYRINKGPAAAVLGLAVAGASIAGAGISSIAGALWEKTSLPERAAPSASAGKDPDSSSSLPSPHAPEIAETNSTGSHPESQSNEAVAASEGSTIDEVVKGSAQTLTQEVFIRARSLIDWGESLGQEASAAISDAVAKGHSYVEAQRNETIGASSPEVAVVNDESGTLGDTPPLAPPPLAMLSPEQSAKEPNPSLPEWVISKVESMGIKDLAAVKEVAPGIYAYCFEGSCTPIPSPKDESDSFEFNTSIPPIVGDFQQEENTSNPEPVPLDEEVVESTVDGEVVAQSEVELAGQSGQTPPTNAVQAEKSPEPVIIEEPKVEKKLLEVKNGVIEGIVNGSVLEVSDNGKSERLTVALGPNVIGTSLRFSGKEWGNLSRTSSSEVNVTLKINPAFKGTVELVPTEILEREKAEAIKIQRAEQAERIKNAITVESTSLTVIDGAPKNSSYVKDAIAQVLEENRDNVVIFVKSVPGPCPPCTTYQPELKKLADQIEREGVTLAGRKVVIVEALFKTFEDADNALERSKVPRTDLILPEGARTPKAASPNAKVFQYDSVSFIGGTKADALLQWVKKQVGE